jgi:hypothetical protein
MSHNKSVLTQDHIHTFSLPESVYSRNPPDHSLENLDKSQIIGKVQGMTSETIITTERIDDFPPFIDRRLTTDGRLV